MIQCMNTCLQPCLGETRQTGQSFQRRAQIEADRWSVGQMFVTAGSGIDEPVRPEDRRAFLRGI